jgi:ECF sigma factor
VSDVTRVIQAVQRGDSKAAEELLPLVYEELRKLAASRMANEAAGNTLQPTALRNIGVRSPQPPKQTQLRQGALLTKDGVQMRVAL